MTGRNALAEGTSKEKGEEREASRVRGKKRTMDESLFDEFGNYIGPEKPLFVQDEGASYLSPSAFANGEDEFAGDQDALSADRTHQPACSVV